MTIEARIIKARPSLRKLLPVVFWQTAVFALLNMLLGLGMFFWEPSIYPYLAPSPMLLKVWALGFALVGLALAWGLLRKRWERLRGLMAVGLLFKFFWSIALCIRVTDGGTFLIASLFIGLALLQTVCIIFYFPPEETSDGTVI